MMHHKMWKITLSLRLKEILSEFLLMLYIQLSSNLFSRFIGDIQNTSDIASSEGIPKIWDLPPSEEAEDQFQADLRAASGIGRMRNKGKGKVSVRCI